MKPRGMYTVIGAGVALVCVAACAMVAFFPQIVEKQCLRNLSSQNEAERNGSLKWLGEKGSARAIPHILEVIRNDHSADRPAVPASLEIRLSPGGSLEGRILGLSPSRDEKRMAQPQIRLRRADGRGAGESERAGFQSASFLEGYYRVEHIEPGTYRVEVKKVVMVRGDFIDVGPNAVGVTTMPEVPEESIPATDLGEVEIHARETTWFDVKVP